MKALWNLCKKLFSCCRDPLVNNAPEVDLARNQVVEDVLPDIDDVGRISEVVDFSVISSDLHEFFLKNSERINQIDYNLFSPTLFDNIWMAYPVTYDWLSVLHSIAVFKSNILWTIIQSTDATFHRELIICLAHFEAGSNLKHSLTLINELDNARLILDMYFSEDNGNTWERTRRATLNYWMEPGHEWWVDNHWSLYNLFTNDSGEVLDKVSYKIIKEDNVTSLISFKHSSAPLEERVFASLL